jgi:alpha-D-xyloside xylohydrolase
MKPYKLALLNKTLLVVLICFLSVVIISCTQSKAKVFFSENKNSFVFSNLKSKLIIEKLSWKILLLDENGLIQYEEAKAPVFMIDEQWISISKVENVESSVDKSVRLHALLSNGKIIIVEVKSLSEYGFNVVIKDKDSVIKAIRGFTRLDTPEQAYGFGETWNGHVAQRGQKIDIWDKPGTPDECAYMPYYVSTNNYAFFLNYGGLVTFDVGKTNPDELVFEAPAPVYDITLISGSSLAEAVQNFMFVTGLPLAPPRWSYEPWFWLMHDPNQPGTRITTLKSEHFIEMINKLRELNIPIGVTWLEPPWQDARTSFIPNTDFSPNLKYLIARISNLGVKTLAWTIPYTTSDSYNWQEAIEKGYLVKNPKEVNLRTNVQISESGELSNNNNYIYIDFFNPEAAKWWQDQVEKSIDLGLKGFKLDGGQSMPKDALLFEGRLAKDVQNSYALEYNKVYYNALKNKLGDDFLMIPRAAWIGSTSYTNSKWPGDLSGSFADNGLRSSVYSALSLAFSGMPFISTDIGGFEGRPCKENVFVRWSQFGAFLPGMQTLHMPWWYSEKTVAHYRYLAWLHRDLTPLWMSLAQEAKIHGSPIIRPLVWSFQNDVNCWAVDDEFTLGDNLLVAPILDSSAMREVYIPEGLWFNFWNEKETITGPVSINWKTNDPESLYKFPLYIREGAIIPMEIENEITGFGTKNFKDYLTLAIWPKTEGISEFSLADMEDNVKISCDRSGNMINLNWTKTAKNYILRLHLVNTVDYVEIDKSGMKTMLNSYNSFDEFNSDQSEGYYFDDKNGNLWTRINNSSTQGSLKVRLK